MTHLELEHLASDYLEGQLDTVRRAEVEAHLAGCAGCQALVADTRHVLELCRAVEAIEPPPWLVPKILRATIGERKPSLGQRLGAFFRPLIQTRVAYGLAMAVFSLSLIVNAAGLDLKHLRAQDLDPRTWVYQANRNGHLLLGRVEKYYYDLKLVYEIESRLRQLRTEPDEQAPRPQTPSGGTTEGAPAGDSPLATSWSPSAVGTGLQLLGRASGWNRPPRSTIR
jgi:putative zinc finger protein